MIPSTVRTPHTTPQEPPRRTDDVVRIRRSEVCIDRIHSTVVDQAQRTGMQIYPLPHPKSIVTSRCRCNHRLTPEAVAGPTQVARDGLLPFPLQLFTQATFEVRSHTLNLKGQTHESVISRRMHVRVFKNLHLAWWRHRESGAQLG